MEHAILFYACGDQLDDCVSWIINKEGLDNEALEDVDQIVIIREDGHDCADVLFKIHWLEIESGESSSKSSLEKLLALAFAAGLREGRK